jgi:hypothetical protein
MVNTKHLNRIAQRVLAHADSIAAALALLMAGAAAMLLAGCGGGGDEPLSLRVAPAAVTTPAPPPTVQLEGCVVDDYFQPRSQTPVRALGADGRLLGNAQSGPRGEFKLRLPAGQSVSLAVDRPDGEVLKVVSGLQSRVLATCLVDPSA